MSKPWKVVISAKNCPHKDLTFGHHRAECEVNKLKPCTEADCPLKKQKEGANE